MQARVRLGTWCAVGATLALGATDAASQVMSERRIGEGLGGFGGLLNPGDHFGSALAALGDLDGDGLTDLAVGAPGDDDGTPGQGAVWIVELGANGFVQSETKLSAATGAFGGALTGGFGSAVAGLGLLDADGVPDLAAGAPDDAGGGVGRGALWIMNLSARGSVLARRRIRSGTNGFTGTLDDHDRFGAALAPLGDLDGDGIIDLAVGAPGDDDGGPDRGALWVLYLNADSTVKSSVKISSSAGGFSGALQNGSLFGSSAAVIGDVDGDGVIDLAVGAPADGDGGPGLGAVWILFLQRNGQVHAQTKLSATAGNFGGDVTRGLGSAVAAADDLNLDGIPELVVGARGHASGPPDEGVVWIVYLSTSGTAIFRQKIAQAFGGFSASLDDRGRFGSAIANVGDLDASGDSDLVIGAPYDGSGGSEQGVFWDVFLGCARPAVASLRNLGFRNPLSYSLTGSDGGRPVIGGTLTMHVDASGTTGHLASTVLGYLSSTDVILPGGGQRLLVDVTHPTGDLLGLGVHRGDLQATVQMPDILALCGVTLYTQGVHLLGVRPYALTNAWDLTFGAF